MQLAGRMHNECAWYDWCVAMRGVHRASASETEVDLGGIGVTMMGAELSGLPACHRHVTVLDFLKDPLDMPFRVPLLLGQEVEYMHRCS
jgi:hypothetical protein